MGFWLTPAERAAPGGPAQRESGGAEAVCCCCCRVRGTSGDEARRRQAVQAALCAVARRSWQPTPETLLCRVKVDTYSKSKYASVIRQAGGWDWFQELLGALQGVAQRHGVTIADVAVRWVLDRPQASARLNIIRRGGSRASLLRQGAGPPCAEDATAAGGGRGGGQARRSRSGCQAPGGLAPASPTVTRAAAAAPCCVACAGGGRDCGRAQRQPRGRPGEGVQV